MFGPVLKHEHEEETPVHLLCVTKTRFLFNTLLYSARLFPAFCSFLCTRNVWEFEQNTANVVFCFVLFINQSNNFFLPRSY